MHTNCTPFGSLPVLLAVTLLLNMKKKAEEMDDDEYINDANEMDDKQVENWTKVRKRKMLDEIKEINTNSIRNPTHRPRLSDLMCYFKG